MADKNTGTGHGEIDAHSGQTTTGHEWDGIKELNTPLPRWWLLTLYATIIWSIGYWVVYPAWPLITSNTTGVIGYSSRADVIADVAAANAAKAGNNAKLAAASFADLSKTPELLTFTLAQGKAAFGNNCAPCHGAGGGGGKGYPNLNDDDWLWGGKLEDIEMTLQHGIRVSTDDQTRVSQMPAFGRDGILKPAEISTTADYVRSLSGLPVEKGADLAAGAKIFAENCAACHGENAKGNPELGAPNLTDAIWLYGSDKAVIEQTLTNGRGGVMPAWGKRLAPETVKALAVYVYSLGGGRK